MISPLAYVDLQDAGNAQSQLVLVALARNVDWETGQGFPGIERLAKMAKCSPRTVQNHIAKLVELGFITVEKRTTESGRQTSNLYTIIGYANWLKTLQKGGKVAAPKTVEKHEIDEEATPQDLQGPPQELQGEGESRLHPRGCKQAAPYLSKDLKDDLKASKIDLNKEEKPRPAHVPEITITSVDLSWQDWTKWLDDNHPQLAAAARHHGVIRTTSRWPRTDSPAPRVASIPRNVTGDAA